jgi:uncharacterized protein YbjT (DUF2867 family)
MRIAVAGGTGVVGRWVVDAVAASGPEPVVLARSRGVDLRTGHGLDAALAGADAVIDVSNVTTTGRRRATGFFTAVTERLLSAGRRAGVRHHVALSIVGVDRVPYGYYIGKRHQERLVLAAGVPGTVLRATQFHEFARQILDRGTWGPVGLVPRMRVQPVAAGEVAEALVSLAMGAPVGMAPELAGPEEHDLADLCRRVAEAVGRPRLVVPVRLPGRAGCAMADGGLLPTGPGPRGTQTFDQWLAATGGRFPTTPPAAG